MKEYTDCVLEFNIFFPILFLQVVHFITFYVPLWGAILFNGFTYFQVIRMLNNATRVCLHLSILSFLFLGKYSVTCLWSRK